MKYITNINQLEAKGKYKIILETKGLVVGDKRTNLKRLKFLNGHLKRERGTVIRYSVKLPIVKNKKTKDEIINFISIIGDARKGINLDKEIKAMDFKNALLELKEKYSEWIVTSMVFDVRDIKVINTNENKAVKIIQDVLGDLIIPIYIIVSEKSKYLKA